MIDSAMSGNVQGANEALGVLQRIIGVCNYLNHEHLQGALSTARQDLMAEIGKADKYMPELKGILDIWKEFEPDYYARAVEKATEYMLARITKINSQMPLGGTLNNPVAAMLIDRAARLKEAMNQIELSSLIGKGSHGSDQGVYTELQSRQVMRGEDLSCFSKQALHAHGCTCESSDTSFHSLRRHCSSD